MSNQVLLYTDGGAWAIPDRVAGQPSYSAGNMSRRWLVAPDHRPTTAWNSRPFSKGLKALTRRCQVTVVTDSQYGDDYFEWW